LLATLVLVGGGWLAWLVGFECYIFDFHAIKLGLQFTKPSPLICFFSLHIKGQQSSKHIIWSEVLKLLLVAN
jgi:hypothetical protein